MKYIFTALILSLFVLAPLPSTNVALASNGTFSKSALKSAFKSLLTKGTTNNGLTSSNSSGNSGLHNPLKVNSLQQLMTAILGFVVKIGTVIVVLMIIFVGFKFVTSQGKPDEIQKARMMLLWTIVGALIILGAQAISLGIAATVTSISAGT